MNPRQRDPAQRTPGSLATLALYTRAFRAACRQKQVGDNLAA
ncbi:hypothetical protein JOE11_002878 [Robbsia andropogonis]|nr:hypothetical protein [Robbsia andropogonis]